jgi:hypothetical protein
MPRKPRKGAVLQHEKLNRVKASDLAKYLAETYRVDLSGCWFVTNKQTPEGEYSRWTIPKKLADQYDHMAHYRKSQRRVHTHAAFYRAHKGLLPDYQTNQDITHTCGKGRATSTTSTCVNPAHLVVASHHANMRAQRCVPFFTCRFCNLTSYVCTHSPRCVGNKAKHRLAKRDLAHVTKVKVTWDNGAISRYKLK